MIGKGQGFGSVFSLFYKQRQEPPKLAEIRARWVATIKPKEVANMDELTAIRRAIMEAVERCEDLDLLDLVLKILLEK